MIPGALHRSPGIYFMAEETPGKLELGDRLMKCVTNHRLKWGPFPRNEVGRLAQGMGWTHLLCFTQCLKETS